MPRNLVIVRAGDQSLHEQWAAPGPTYDLVVSYYGDHPTRFRKGALLRHDAKGGKLEGVYRLLTDHPLLFDCYDYVCMSDDDVVLHPAALARLFYLMRFHDLKVAQPALDSESYVNLRITAQHEGFLLRHTNLVEVMAPCFKVSHLRRVLPHFLGKRFGWGIDYYWSALAGARGAAVVDTCTMTHTRPSGTGPLYAEGNPELERKALLAEIGWVALPRPEVTGAVLRNGTVLDQRNPLLSRLVRAADTRLRMQVAP